MVVTCPVVVRISVCTISSRYSTIVLLVLMISTFFHDSIAYYHGLPYLLPICFSFIAGL